MEYRLTNETTVSVDLEKGELASVFYRGRSLTDGRAAIFSVKVRKRTGESYVIPSTACEFVCYENGAACYTCESFEAKILFAEKEGSLSVRANVCNKTEDVLEWIELMPVSLPEKLKDEQGGVGEIVYPYNEGCRVTNMAYRESMPFRYTEPEYPSKGSFSVFPNMVFAQFIAYVGDGAGIYLGMHDAERTTKHIDFCYHGGKIKMFMRTFCDVHYGEDYAMPFDYVLRVFEGEWYAAADIYYEWFTKHLPDGLKKKEENTNLPTWYHRAPLVVAYPLRGKHDTDISPNGLYPYKNAMPLLQEIAAQTESEVMALVMHWEGTAPWAPPFSWPPYGGEEEFNAFADELHESGMLLGVYCSGYGWTQRSKTDPQYHCEEAFEKLGIAESLCTDSNGELKSVICTAQRDGYDFCPSTETTKRIFKTEFDKICASKLDYVQALDQNHGGASYFCYSERHGHVPAPGKWQQIETNKLLSSIDKKGVLLGCESAAAEPFLAQLQFSDKRYELNYYIGTPIPLYEYLYHEYVTNFMGNQICAMLEKADNNFTYRLAYSFAAGDALTLVMSGDGEFQYSWCDGVEPLEQTLDKSVVLPFIKTLTKWRKGGASKFLHYGKMIPPAKVHCATERFLCGDGVTYLTSDSAISVAYAHGGKRVQLLINYNLYEVEITFDRPYNVYTDADLQNAQRVERCTMQPLSVILLGLE